MKHVVERPGYLEVHLTKGLVAKVDLSDRALIECVSWRASKSSAGLYYARGYFQGVDMYMHVLLAGPVPTGKEVDHRNGDTLDNRRANMRVCTRRQNYRNRGKRPNCTSRFKGVCRLKGCDRWRAYIRTASGFRHLGTFSREEDAAKAYNRAAIRYFKLFALLNEVD